MTKEELLVGIEQKKDELLHKAKVLVESGKSEEELESYYREQLESFTKEIVKDKDFDRILEEMQEDAPNRILSNPDPLTSLIVLKLLGEHSQFDLSTLNQDIIKGLSSVLEKPLSDKIDDILYKKDNSIKKEPVSEELESWDKFSHIDDAIEDYCRYDSHIVFFTESLNGEPLEEADDREQIESAFKAGAHWQKQQMMKDAVDGRFSYNPNFKENEFICLEKSDTPEHYLGELVKVIIIKEEE